MDFYYGVLSGNSARAAFALLETGAPYTPHSFDRPDGDNRAAGYLALNPMGKVPALVDGEVRLWESNAINWYLAETHPAARLLPASAAGRAAVQRWLLFQVGHVTPACHVIFRGTNRRVQAFWNVNATPQAVEAARTELARYLAVLEQALADRIWLEGDFSLADIAYAPHLAMIAEGRFDFSATPQVRAWLERLWARPAWQRAAAMTLGTPPAP
jgi:glutathione S-transferase